MPYLTWTVFQCQMFPLCSQSWVPWKTSSERHCTCWIRNATTSHILANTCSITGPLFPSFSQQVVLAMPKTPAVRPSIENLYPGFTPSSLWTCLCASQQRAVGHRALQSSQLELWGNREFSKIGLLLREKVNSPISLYKKKKQTALQPYVYPSTKP